MQADPTSRDTPSDVLLVAPFDRCHLLFMLREQIAGDTELLREIGAGTARHDAGEVRDRLDFCWGLAGQLGGLFADELPDAA